MTQKRTLKKCGEKKKCDWYPSLMTQKALKIHKTKIDCCLKQQQQLQKPMTFCKNDSCGYRNVNILIRWLNSSMDKTKD